MIFLELRKTSPIDRSNFTLFLVGYLQGPLFVAEKAPPLTHLLHANQVPLSRGLTCCMCGSTESVGDHAESVGEHGVSDSSQWLA